MNSNARVLIIGGGPAGTACAIRLRQRGVPVELAEQQSFPRGKVCGCCIGGAGLNVLASLDLKQTIESAGARVETWRGSIGERLAELPLPAGVAISRQSLDTLLMEKAESLGASVWRECRAKITDSDSERVSVSLESPDRQCNRPYDCVIVAAGLTAAGMSGYLPWIKSPSGPFGISFTAPPETKCQDGVIHMACDGDGYVGVVRLENGWVDIAAALTSGSAAARKGTPVQRVLEILSQSQFSDLRVDAPSKWMTTPPLRRRRLPGKGRILAIGDSAGYVEPFTGEGMTWAMQSGAAAAEEIAANRDALAGIGERWTQVYTRKQSRHLLCRGVTSALRWSPARFLAGRALASCPSLARPLVGRLNPHAQ